MRVLITGSGGQVGRALSETAPARTEVVSFTRQELDIAEPASVRRIIEDTAPAVIINTAAFTGVDRAESEEKEAFRINAFGAASLAQICSEQGVQLVHLSTDFVFDGCKSSPYSPADVAAPQSAYGRSKLAGEIAVLADPRNLVIRTAWVYGNHGHNFVKTMLRLISERKELSVVADQIGTPTHARSLARCIWALVLREARGLLHFTDAGAASWYDFAVAIQEESAALGLTERAIPILPITAAEYPTAAVRPTYSVLDKSECWAIVGIPARHWRVELREMLADEKERNV